MNTRIVIFFTIIGVVSFPGLSMKEIPEGPKNKNIFSEALRDYDRDILCWFVQCAKENGIRAKKEDDRIRYEADYPYSYAAAYASAEKEIVRGVEDKIFHVCTIKLSDDDSIPISYLAHNKRLTPCPAPTVGTHYNYTTLLRRSVVKNTTVFYLIYENNIPGLYQWMIMNNMKGKVFKGKAGSFPFFADPAYVYAQKQHGKKSLIAQILRVCAYLNQKTERLFEMFQHSLFNISSQERGTLKKESTDRGRQEERKEHDVTVYLNID